MKRFLFGVGIALAASLVILATTSDTGSPNTTVTNTSSSPSAGKVPDFAHIFLIIEENKSPNDLIGSPSAPYINFLALNGSLLLNYHATAHPSLPNYLDMTSGTNGTITSDCAPGPECELNVRSLPDEIEASGLTWKEYAEGMPNECGTTNEGEYATKHNPFVYYSDILHNPARCASHVVPFSQLGADLDAAKDPNYSFITPNLCDDMHDCSIGTGDKWLKKVVPEIQDATSCTRQSCLIVVTWDENDSGSTNVAAIMVGAGVREGYQSNSYYNHYSLLHTIESAWGLEPLTNEVKSAPIINDVF